MPEENNRQNRVFFNNAHWEGLADNVNVTIAEFEAQQAQVMQRIRNRQQRRNNGNGAVLDTVGIELESLGLSREYVGNLLARVIDGLGNNWKVHRDGSSEMNVYYISLGGNRENRIAVNAHTKEAQELFANSIPQSTIGYELISIPMDIEVAELSLWALLPLLKFNADFISERCATHVHVGGMTRNLQFLKNSLILGLWFDEVFYSIAHLDGEKFRGYSNNANYARPLVNGPYFPYDRTYYQTLNWKKALKANDLYEFFAAYAINVDGELPKYHPARYFGINLYSIPRIGTVEFRHFNQSFNPGIVTSVVKLCQLFVEIAMKARTKELIKLEPGNPFETNSPSHYIHKLHTMINIGRDNDCTYNLSVNDIDELERVIMRYKGIGIEDIPILTHCKDLDISSKVIEDGGLIRAKSKPSHSGYVDIHNIKYQSILKG